MVKNTVQFQGGLSLPRSPATCGTEAQRRLTLFTMRRPQGFRCPKCGHKHCSALQSRKLYQCRHRFQVSLTQGAIFASIKLLLPIWMLAVLPGHPVHTPSRLFLFTVRGPIVYG